MLNHFTCTEHGNVCDVSAEVVTLMALHKMSERRQVPWGFILWWTSTSLTISWPPSCSSSLNKSTNTAEKKLSKLVCVSATDCAEIDFSASKYGKRQDVWVDDVLEAEFSLLMCLLRDKSEIMLRSVPVLVFCIVRLWREVRLHFILQSYFVACCTDLTQKH